MKKNVIKKIKLVGIKNTKIMFEIHNQEKNTSVLLKINSKETLCKPISYFNNITLYSMELNKVKLIEIYIQKGNNKILLKKVKNNLLKRIGNKIKYSFRSLFYKCYYKIKLLFRPFNVLIRGIKFLWREHRFLVPPILWKKYFKLFLHKIGKSFDMYSYNPFNTKSYNKWIKECEVFTPYKKLKYNPLISILIPVYNIEREYLSKCLDSILNQTYQNFEICLSDDNSSRVETIETLKEYEKKDNRIKVVYRKENGHISKATNSALKIAKGEFIALMDNDDELSKYALFEMVNVLNQNQNIDMIYSDEDKLDMNGNRCEPHFKSDYAPDSLLGGNYICHFEILRKSIVDKIGGFDHEMVGAQDFDLFLRFVENTTPEKIYHIPKVLYHWRKIPGSTADTIENKDYAILAGKRAVENALKRRGLEGKVHLPIQTTHYLVEYTYKKEPKVSIIIPTKDKVNLLNKCVNSILKKTDYKNYEIIIVDNNSEEKETKKYFDSLEKNHKNIKVLKYDGEFNFSAINNYAVKKSTGDYLLFLNNDTEVITPKWISYMVGYAMQKHIGTVGVKLFYADNTIQHGGVILNKEEVAKHTFLKTPRESYGWYGRLLVQHNYSAVTAACMMVSKEKFDEVNGFDENLKVAYNDVDLNLSLLNKNYLNVFLPNVEMYHYESASRGIDTTTEKYSTYLKENNYISAKQKENLEYDKFYNENLSFEEDFMLKKPKKQKNQRKWFYIIPILLMLAFLIDYRYVMTKPSTNALKKIDVIHTLDDTSEDITYHDYNIDNDYMIPKTTSNIEIKKDVVSNYKAMQIKLENIMAPDVVDIYFLNLDESVNSLKKIEQVFDENLILMFNIPEYDYDKIIIDIDVPFKIAEIGFSENNVEISNNYSINVLRILIIFIVSLVLCYGTLLLIERNIISNCIKKIKYRYLALYLITPIISLIIEKLIFDTKFVFDNFWLIEIIILLITSTFVFVVNKIKIEYYFLVFCLLLGSLMVFCSSSPRFVSWDEAIHYSWSQSISKFGNNEFVTGERSYMYNNKLSYEDLDYVDFQYKNSIPVEVNYELSWNNLGNIPNAVGLFLGRLANLNINDLIIMGRLSNLIIYAILIFCGIKKLIHGKLIFSVIALFPTSLFLAVSYTYDSFMTALIIYGLCYFLSLMQNEAIKINKKNTIVMTLIMSTALLIKAIYFPLLLIFLIIPKEKFENTNARKFHTKFVILFTFILIVSFVLPFFLFGKHADDLRGGNDVDSIEQIKYILFNPIEYVKTLIDFNIGYFNINNYYSVMNFWAYLGHVPNGILILLVYFYSILFDKGEKDLWFSNTKKWMVFIFCLIAFVLMTTSLYIAFNPVGNNIINGMHHRYIVPALIFLSYFMFNGVKNYKSKNKNIAFVIVFLIIAYVIINGVITVL